MIVEKIDLYACLGVERRGAAGGYLTAYARTPLCEIKGKLRPAMLIMPGGGYKFVSVREGEPVALAFVLEYSVNTPHPAPLLEACMAVAYIRENADKWSVNKTQIGAIGFSAGGHLAGMLATAYSDGDIAALLGKRATLTRPDAVILSYPVVSMREDICLGSTRVVISGNGALPYEKFSVDLLVNENSVPAYIWHTFRDNIVPVEHSLLLAQAYNRAGVPFSLHIFESGLHGLSLANAEVNDCTPQDLEWAHIGKWFSLAADWLKSRGFGVKTV